MKKYRLNIFILLVVMSLFLVACEEEKKVEPAIDRDKFVGEYIVDATYLKEKVEDENENVIIIDARGSDAAKDGTVKGSVAFPWQSLAKVSDGKSGDAMWGTILEAEELAKVLGSLGIAKDKEIIIFAGSGQGWGDEGRILWSLDAAGYENLKMVDTNYEGIVAAGVPIVKGTATLEPVSVEIPSIDNTHIINTEDLKANYDNFKIIDVRNLDEYNGATLYGETKGGHLPGAIHIPFVDFFNEDNTLKSNKDLEKMFSDAGLSKDDTIVAYCTAGIRSAYAQLLLEMLGYENTLNYDESFYRWSAVEEVE